MKFNFKSVLNSVLGGSKKVVGDLEGENGLIAKSITKGQGNRQYERSLRGRSENFILQFPVVVSNGISIDGVEVIRNQVELERSVDISTVINNTPVVNMAGANGYLDGYHNNVYMTNNSPLSLKANATMSSFMEANEELLADGEDILESKSLNTRSLPVELMEASPIAPGASVEMFDETEVNDTPLEVSRKPIHASASKFERLNRTTPLLSRMKVTFAIKDPNDDNKIKGTVENKEVVFGVKGVVHVVNAQDIVYFLGDSSKRSNALSRLVKLTTGEIGFFREFLLNVDRSKKIASSRQSNVWNTMNSMFTVEKMNQYRKVKGGMIPTITLAISVDEVEQIRMSTGIDLLSNRRAASKIFDELFHLDFYIVDEANQLAHKYVPRERNFEPITLSAMSGRDLNDRNKANNNAEDLLKRLLSNRR